MKLLRNIKDEWLSYETSFLEENLRKGNFWGLATSLDIYWCDPDIIRDSDSISRYVKELCDLIEMKRFWDTQIVHFGEDEKVEWFSMIQLIETSLISGHFANKTNASYLDIFSCKYYDPQVMADFSLKFFKWDYYKINVSSRDTK